MEFAKNLHLNPKTQIVENLPISTKTTPLQGAALLTNWRKSRKNDTANRHYDVMSCRRPGSLTPGIG